MTLLKHTSPCVRQTIAFYMWYQASLLSIQCYLKTLSQVSLKTNPALKQESAYFQVFQ